jgi:hypothetical protein
MRLRALLLALLVLALAACGSDDDEAAAPTPVTVTETETETVTETETAPAEPEPDCSTAGLRLMLHEQELPPAVADVRQRVFDAAVACDYETLAQIAAEKGEGFTFSYGASEDAAAYWSEVEAKGEERPLPMRALATILTMPFTRNESGSYAWPPAYSENPTEEDWQSLVYGGLYTGEEVEQMKAQGTGYLGYRTAITQDGDWQFFVAGD